MKAAAAEFLAVLGAYPQEDRPAVFLQSSGLMLVEAMRAQGTALDLKKFGELGISLPPVEGATGNTSKIPFKTKGGRSVSCEPRLPPSTPTQQVVCDRSNFRYGEHRP